MHNDKTSDTRHGYIPRPLALSSTEAGDKRISDALGGEHETLEEVGSQFPVKPSRVVMNQKVKGWVFLLVW